MAKSIQPTNAKSKRFRRPQRAHDGFQVYLEDHFGVKTYFGGVIGPLIREARNKAGLSQEELGFKSNLSRNYISMIELGQASPTLDTLLDICAALNVAAHKLVRQMELGRARKSSGKR